jgi:hypothetical protein
MMSEIQVRYKADDFIIEIGSTHPMLDAFMEQKEVQRWALLTAENPNSEEFPFYVNKQRTGVLRKELQHRGFLMIEAVGESNLKEVPNEHCFLVIGISLQEAVDFAIRYDQDAIVTGTLKGFAEIVGIRS